MAAPPEPTTGNITPQILQKVAGRLGKEWREVARNLQIDDADLYRIETDSGNNIGEAIYQTLQRWQKKNGSNATVSALINALRKAGRNDIADMLLDEQNSSIFQENEEAGRESLLSGMTRTMKLHDSMTPVRGTNFNPAGSTSAEALKSSDGQYTQMQERILNEVDNTQTSSQTRCDGILVGGVIISAKQLVHIYDARESGNGVVLVCVDPKDPDKKSWKHVVKEIGDQSPVVMSRRAILYNRSYHVLFACGKLVFIVEFHCSPTCYDSVEKVETLEINAVPENSWITCIFGHQPTKDPCNEFLIATNSSTSLFVYNVPGRRNNTVETRDIVPNADFNTAAFCAENFAFINRSDNEVIVLSINNERKHCSFLQPPEGLPKLTPIDLICTGLRWLVMYLHEDEQGKWWTVVAYKIGDVNAKKNCIEGACDMNVGNPVSITHSQRIGIVSFDSGKVVTFKF